MRKIAVIGFMCMVFSVFGQKTISTIDIHHYRIHLRLDWEKRKILGEATIYLTLNQSGKTILLAANQLAIRAVNGKWGKIPFKVDSIQNHLQLLLPKTYKAGEKLEFSIVYETLYHNDSDPNAIGGSFGKGLRFFEPTNANPVKRQQVWSQSEWNNLSYWLPFSHNFTDLISSEISATVENHITFIANGKLISKKENPDKTITFQYKTEKPYPAYLTAFVAGEYVDYTQQKNDITLHTFCYPDELEAAKATTVGLPNMFAFLEEQTGFKYPYKYYTQVMVHDYPFPSQTGQNTMTLISDNMIDDYGTHKDYLYLWDGVEFNALASQWFGNIIAPKSIEDLWLSKGFAQYFEGLYAAAQNGMEEYLLWYHPWETNSVMGDWLNGNRHAIVPSQVENPEDFAKDSYSKYRGALVLRMLELELGKEDFQKSIQFFIKKNAFKHSSTADFQAAIKKQTGKDLSWFFKQWLYQTGHPVFEWTSQYDEKEQQLILDIQQIQNQDTTTNNALSPYFKGKIEIEIDHSVVVVDILPQASNKFSIKIPKLPLIINLDPNNRWIRELKNEKSKEAYLKELLDSKYILSRNTAMIELVAFAQKETTSLEEKNEIIQAFQTIITSDTYWRFRYNLIGQLRNIQPLPYDSTMVHLLISLIKKEKSWVKAAAITNLGMTKDKNFEKIYLQCFSDTSDRVINAAAIALGKTESPNAFDALIKLKGKPSWKNQSLMHCLAGLAQLKDARTEEVALAALKDIHSPRWYLGNGWDYPYAAVQTLAKIGKTEKAYAILSERFYAAIQENHTDDIFHLVNLITVLANPLGVEIFEPLKKKYEQDANAMTAILFFEEQLKSSISK